MKAPDNTPKPGKRDYTWTIDTISYEGSIQTTLYRIWGSSPRDVWAGGFNERGWGELYHFNGTRWQVVIHGYRKIGVGDIYGFGQNDVWLVGDYTYINPNPPPFFLDSSVILHYNGIRWTEVPHERGRSLQGIWGPTPDRMFACGTFGTVYRYDSSVWKKLPSDERVWFAKIGGRADEIYMTGYTPPGYTPDTIGREYLFKWSDSTFVPVDSVMLVPGYTPRFGINEIMASGGTIYSVGAGVFRKDTDMWRQVISDGRSFTGLYGTRPEHLFVSGTRKTLYHFNGSDWAKLEIPGNPNLPLYGIWCSEDEVFVVGEDNARTFIIHGR